MRLLPAILLASVAFGQAYTISTFAGGGLPNGVPGSSANVGDADAVAVDSVGNVFLSSGPQCCVNSVFRLDAKTGLLTLVAGDGAPSFSGDNGPATSAGLANPWGVAADSAGNFFIADVGNNRIRKISNGIITTVVGNGTAGFSGDNGLATSAQLNQAYGIIVDSSGNLYIADAGNNRIRKVSNGVITTVVGNGTAGFSGDNGPATSAQLNGPTGLTLDSAANLYIADRGNMCIRKVANGVITTIAGGGAGSGGDGGPATSAGVANPLGVAVDSVGDLYIAQEFGSLRKVANGIITTVVEGLCCFGGDNGPATQAELDDPLGVAVDPAGSLYIADRVNMRIRKVSNGLIATVAGNGSFGFSGDNGPATSAALLAPQSVAVDPAGNLYIADAGRIRKVSNGVITTVAGNGVAGFGGDNGPATNAQLYTPGGVAVDSAGNLYIADTYNNRVRKVANGVITTVAGNGTAGLSGDNGPATSAELYRPAGVAVDSAGGLYIVDTNNSRIRRVSNGVITTVAGGGGEMGDNGPATSAQLSPTGVAMDSAGNLYITDLSNRVRKVSNGIITTVAGNGTAGFSGDNGLATSAELDQPNGVALDPTGNIYFADAINNRIRLLTPSATTPTISISGVNNAASNLSGAISPGEIVTITGSGLGPAQLTSASVGSDGLYDAGLAGTSVQFNGIPAPMIYTSATQVAAIVPYEVTGDASALATVTYQGQTSASATMAVVASAPGLFTLGSTGQGQAAVVNQNGTINTASTPAPVGSIVSLYATGEGQTSPSGTDGKPASDSPPKPILPVSVTIGGLTVDNLQYVGGAPGEVAGLLQINVQVPSGVTPGSAAPVVIQVGGATSQAGVTIAVSAN